MEDKKNIKKVKYSSLHKLISGISLIAFVVTVLAGLMAQARITTITVRALVVMLVIAGISRIIMRIIASYEEMNGGQA